MSDLNSNSPAPARGFSTRAIHVPAPSISQQPSSFPLYQGSTWRFASMEEFAEVIAGDQPGYVYGRGYGNPTVEAFEAVMADLEGTEAAIAFDSGMAAIHAVVTALATSGQRVVASRDLYGGSYSLFHELLPRYGITTTFVDVAELDLVKEVVEGASVLYVETIANPGLQVADLPAIAELCRQAGVPSVIDSTFATPYLCTPAAFGFDYVVHSATKYLAGHSDVIGGVVCTSAERRRAMRSLVLDTGGAMQPFEAWLCLRGLATLELRMERHCSSALGLAHLLQASGAVAATYYPGLPGDPSFDRAKVLLRGAGGVVAFEHAGGLDGARKFCDALQLAWLAASLGGIHTLVAHPASTTHRQVDPETRRATGVTDGLVRVSVGLESPEDLEADVRQALGG